MTASITTVDGGGAASKTRQRAAIYARVAIQPQDQPNAALDEQTAACAAYCTAHGYTGVDRYIDAGYSGNTDQRPALGRLLRDAEAGAFDTVVVADLARLARDERLQADLLADLRRTGVAVAAV